MCLTIPKKVIKIEDNIIYVENGQGDNEELKTIIDLEIGDYVLSQRGIIIEKVDQKEAKELLLMIKNYGR